MTKIRKTEKPIPNADDSARQPPSGNVVLFLKTGVEIVVFVLVLLWFVDVDVRNMEQTISNRILMNVNIVIDEKFLIKLLSKSASEFLRSNILIRASRLFCRFSNFEKS